MFSQWCFNGVSKQNETKNYVQTFKKNLKLNSEIEMRWAKKWEKTQIVCIILFVLRKI